MDLARVAWNAVVFAVSLILLGISLPKALGLAALTTISAFVGYGTRWIYRFGFGLMILAILASLNIVPPLTQWNAAMNKVATSFMLALSQKSAAQ